MKQAGRSGSNIYLIGPMGAGKTTVGRQLARRLHRDFYDCDREIELAAGVDITTIFEFEGEAGFRQRETRTLKRLVELSEIVVATGGGAVLSEENRQLLSGTGLVVYLEATVDEQLRRTGHDRTRPLLQSNERLATLERLAEERTPLYLALADVRVRTEGQNTRAVVARLMNDLQSL